MRSVILAVFKINNDLIAYRRAHFLLCARQYDVEVNFADRFFGFAYFRWWFILILIMNLCPKVVDRSVGEIMGGRAKSRTVTE